MVYKLVLIFILTFSPFFCFAAHAGSKGKLKADPNQKLLLIVGCGRSGTRYISNLLTLNKLGIGHEHMGVHGTVNWNLAAIDSGYKFTHIFHQVRNPLAVMSSWYTNFQHHPVWNFIRKHLPEISPGDSEIVRCAKYWYYWNLKAERIAEWRYRIEDIDSVYEEIGRRINHPLDKRLLRIVPKTVNHGQNIVRSITWADIRRECPEDLVQKLESMAIRYGYPIN